MKHDWCRILATLALILALTAGVVALAENAEPGTPTPPQAEQTPPETTPQETTPQDEDARDAALRDALSAYRAAKKASRLAALEEELKGYVEAGKLTQEQADLILEYCNGERPSMRMDGRASRGGRFNADRSRDQGGRMNPDHGAGSDRPRHSASGRQGGKGNADQADGTASMPGETTRPGLGVTGTI